MKIVCEACQAKYSISDDKVRGKAFKIRCKKCSHIIVVRSTSASMPTADGSSASQLPMHEGSGLQSSVAPVAPENSWHIVVEGEQVGPLSASDVRARLARGEVTGETFIWREGLADWLKISSVPEFASAGGGEDDAGTPFPSQPPTTVYPPGTAESAFAASPRGSDQDVFAAPTMVSSSPSADLFASTSAAPEPAPSPSFSFGSAGAQMENGSGRHTHGNGAAGGGLTGQRHENSVLFSLSNLEALASPASSSPSSLPRPGISNSGGSDGSGLIDIRSMAAMTLGSQNEPRHSSDLPTFGAPQFSPVAPVLLPLGPSGGPSKLIYVLIAVGVLFTLVVGGAAVLLLRKPAPAPAPAPVAVAPAATPAPTAAAPTPAAAPTTAPPVTPPAATNEVLPPRETKPAVVATGKGGKKPGKPGKGAKGGDALGLPGVAASGSPAPAPTPKADTKPDLGKRDKLDELLDGALGSKPKPTARPREDEPAKPAPAASSSLPALEKSDIVRAMMALNPKVHECFNQFKVPGTAMVTMKLKDGGRVSDVSVGGKFANTPTGTCVESAARTAKFPSTGAQTIQYPFPLR